MCLQAEWERVMKPSVVDAFLSYIPEKVRAVEILGILKESIIPYIIRIIPEKLVRQYCILVFVRLYKQSFVYR